jgi:hypothetical protein
MLAQRAVPGGAFSAPSFNNFPSYFHQPTYYKWNLEVQQTLKGNMLLSVNYSGMHGSHLPIADFGLNAYCPPSVCPDGFKGLPTAPANPAFGTVLQYLSAGAANYDGLTPVCVCGSRTVRPRFTRSPERFAALAVFTRASAGRWRMQIAGDRRGATHGLLWYE